MDFLGSVADNGGLWGLLLVGGLLLLALGKAWKAWRFVGASVQTRGEVIAYESREVEASNDDGGAMSKVYSQVIRYTDRDGVARTFNGPFTATRKRNTIGTSVAIRYHPQQTVPPQEDSTKSIYGQPITLLIISIVVFVITLLAT